ncbi:hypothetical protein F5Y14DRAFT_428908 [Nemania sp. NC0429]|nr:hypothetical protein F5Y14DRAFT_428908 [Nemania sp. NC0429]
MSIARKITVAACLALTAIANPIGTAATPSSIRTRQGGGDPSILFQPIMYRVFPLEANWSEPAFTQLEVLRSGDVSIIENIAVFEGIPADAKTCTLGWAQGAKAERTGFAVQGSGLLATQQLARLPDGVVSWESVTPIVNEAVEQGRPLLHPDTTSWPAIEIAVTHIAGPVQCAETIYIKVQVDDRNHAGSVYFGQDAKNGLTLTVVQ